MQRSNLGVMLERSQELKVFSVLLDGLDGLYDQAFAPTISDQRAEVWLRRLLVVAAAAFVGSQWERTLLDAAEEIRSVLVSGASTEDQNRAALDATDRLRGLLAAEE